MRVVRKFILDLRWSQSSVLCLTKKNINILQVYIIKSACLYKMHTATFSPTIYYLLYMIGSHGSWHPKCTATWS